MYQVYLMEFPYKKSRSSIEPNPKQRIITLNELTEGRFWGYELVLNKQHLITVSTEKVKDMLVQGRGVRLI